MPLTHRRWGRNPRFRFTIIVEGRLLSAHLTDILGNKTSFCGVQEEKEKEDFCSFEAHAKKIMSDQGK